MSENVQVAMKQAMQAHVSALALSLPYPAPPLTFDNVLEAVKTVRDWRDLGSWLGLDSSKLDAIQRQHISDEACLKAVVESFLLREGVYQPSWRRLIHALYKAEESHLAEKIKTNAEPHQGEWVYREGGDYVCTLACWDRTVCVCMYEREEV